MGEYNVDSSLIIYIFSCVLSSVYLLMRFFGRIIKYLLRSIFSIIIFLLLVGLAKMDRDTNAYISFLNNHDRSLFHRSQPATWTDPFWSHQSSGAIADMFSGDTIDAELSGFDVYDPAFEQELNAIPDASLSGSNEEDFGFTTDGQTTSDIEISAGTSSLSQLIKQRELAK